LNDASLSDASLSDASLSDASLNNISLSDTNSNCKAFERMCENRLKREEKIKIVKDANA